MLLWGCFSGISKCRCFLKIGFAEVVFSFSHFSSSSQQFVADGMLWQAAFSCVY